MNLKYHTEGLSLKKIATLDKTIFNHEFDANLLGLDLSRL